ncbi:MAG: right-handed parallel beta-helix repeat-containing protein [Deltaproteobacteria bacterium]|nr:right-handed parallel beta-helix repeat-containing protein [Deltaproteobacteria bacterium]
MYFGRFLGLIQTTTASALLGAVVLQAGGCSDDSSEPAAGVADCSRALELKNSDIQGGTTIPAGACYLVNENLVLDSGVVVAEEGVVLLFSTGRSFVIKSGGQLRLDGSADAPVRLSSRDGASTWKGVQFVDSQGEDNVWSFVEIGRAGDAKWTGAAYSSAAIYLTGSTKLAMDNVTISDSASHGLIALEDVDFSFTNGTFEDNDTPAYVHPQVAGRIAPETVFSGNTNSYIRVAFGSSDGVEGEETWPAHIYRVEDRVTVRGQLTVLPGAVIEFAQDASMVVEANAALVAKGTEAEVITFKGASETRGFWKGIEVRSAGAGGGAGASSGLGATFEHCVIRDGGGQAWSGASESSAALYLQQASSTKIADTTFSNSARYALWASEDARLPDFGGNTFSGNARVMILHPDRVGELAGNSAVHDNDDDAIYVVFSSSNRVTLDATWKNLGAPYVVRDLFQVAAALAIDPGVEIRFAQDKGMVVDAVGSLTVNGTLTAPVLFRGENEVVAGYWQGVRVESNSEANRLTHTTLAHAGSKRWTGAAESDAAIYLDNNAKLALEDVTVGPGGGYGAVVAGDGSQLTCVDVVFSSLVKEPIWDAPSGAALANCP